MWVASTYQFCWNVACTRTNITNTFARPWVISMFFSIKFIVYHFIFFGFYVHVAHVCPLIQNSYSWIRDSIIIYAIMHIDYPRIEWLCSVRPFCVLKVTTDSNKEKNLLSLSFACRRIVRCIFIYLFIFSRLRQRMLIPDFFFIN